MIIPLNLLDHVIGSGESAVEFSTCLIHKMGMGKSIPGRSDMKAHLRQPLDDRFFGTEEKCSLDVELFVNRALNEDVQMMLGNYFRSLSAKKKK